jgi:N-acyl-D-amino-acid deacylase
MIADVGNLAMARGKQELDARGRVVCPGFVDAHAHDDLWLLHDPICEPKLRQGVTTEVLGQDGLSHAPASSQTQTVVDALWRGINGDRPASATWNSVAEYLSELDGHTAVNTAYLVPHLTVRIEVMGLAQRKATQAEVDAMCGIVSSAMAHGAIGLSSGLTYWPASYATSDELVALCDVVAAWGGVYATHLRDYHDRIVEAIEEAISIGQQANVPVHISHLNHRAEVVLPPIERARHSGVDVTFDLYPYLVGNTLLAQFIPSWVHGDSVEETLQRLEDPAIREEMRSEICTDTAAWENYRLSNVPGDGGGRLVGLSIPEAARLTGRGLTDTICDLVISSRMAVSVLAFHTHRDEDDVRTLMRHPAGMFCTDAILASGRPHPRGYGTYPRILGRYVRQKRILTLEEAVRKMTSLPAQRFGFADRGILGKGMVADIVVLDAEAVIDQATYEQPRQWSRGIEGVWVNGVLVLGPDGPTGATPGRALKPLLEGNRT